MPKKTRAHKNGVEIGKNASIDIGMNANQQIANLIELAETYARHRNLELSSVSQYAGNQGRLFERLKAGHEITFGRAERLVQWFSNNWPDGKPWPKGIKRPPRSKKARAA